MIVTLTLNPSLDRTFVIDRLVPSELNRALEVRTDPAGKGVNVAKALHANGVETIAVLPIGGALGSELLRLLERDGVPCQPVPIEGAVRSNVSILEADGTVTKVNEPGPTLTASELDAVVDAALDHSRRGGWLVACGNLPPGAPSDTYRTVAERAEAAGLRFALDTSGPALANALEARLSLIKPNLEELRELTSQALLSLGEAAQAAEFLSADGVEQVLVSLGRAGALLAVDGEVHHGMVTVDEVRDTVGAGDALLAGYLAGEGNPVASLEIGLAWAKSALGTPGTAAMAATPGDFAGVVISKEIDQHFPLDRTRTEVAIER